MSRLVSLPIANCRFEELSRLSDKLAIGNWQSAIGHRQLAIGNQPEDCLQ